MTESEKWLKIKIAEYNDDRVESLLDMLERTNNVIEQYIGSSGKAQAGLLKSCVEHNKMFLNKVNYDILHRN